jgi:hypothetical protein
VICTWTCFISAPARVSRTDSLSSAILTLAPTPHDHSHQPTRQQNAVQLPDLPQTLSLFTSNHSTSLQPSTCLTYHTICTHQDKSSPYRQDVHEAIQLQAPLQQHLLTRRLRQRRRGLPAQGREQQQPSKVSRGRHGPDHLGRPHRFCRGGAETRTFCLAIPSFCVIFCFQRLMFMDGVVVGIGEVRGPQRLQAWEPG